MPECSFSYGIAKTIRKTFGYDQYKIYQYVMLWKEQNTVAGYSYT